MVRSVMVMAAASVVVLAGCGDDAAGGRADGADRVDVVAAFYPLAEVAQRVGGDRASVSNLTPPGVEPHDVELSTDRVDQLLDADIVVYLGAGFQPAVEDIVGRIDGTAVDVLADAELRPRGDDDHGHDGDAAEDDGEHAEESDLDPHVWLDPRRMADIVERVRDAYVDADPDGEAAYDGAADEYLGALDQLDRELAAGLADCDRDAIVTSHAAFGYLAARYGLAQDAITGLSPESEPDPARMAELADEVRSEGITTIFYETLVAPDVAETLAREAGVDTAVLDPIEGLSDARLDAGDTYFTVMRENLTVLRTALGCR